MKSRKRLHRALLAAGAALILAGCYTVPETGRSALNLIGDDQLALMAQEQFSTMKQEVPISTNRAYNEQVQRVGRRIAQVVGDEIENPEWEFVVFEDDQINAFAMPGGKVGVYTGLLKLVDSDDELATVMGHEIGHVIAKHGSERVSQGMIAELGAVGLGIFLGDQSQTTQQLAMMAYGVGAQVGALLPFSRLQEREADHIGLIYMARAGYDPRAALSFWEKMSNASGGGAPPQFLSTHPNHEDRIRRLRDLIPEVMPEYELARAN